MDFATPGQVVERKGSRRFSLSHLFRERFTSYDVQRTTAFSVREEYTVDETVTFMVPPGKSLRHKVPCIDISNALFDCDCELTESSNSLVIRRTITGKSATLEPEQMLRIAEHIRFLNDIENAYVITE
jgi:hypothetical protein